ncbi:MAG: hypothetical protein KDA28_06345, partial [Phycisphaerales bacterium]|nr:hypothetical protein [Phycisphaerales bacterium]
MAGDPKKPEVGEIHIDASSCSAYVVDLPPGGMVGLLSDHEGVNLVVDEVVANQSTWGDAAGVTAGDFADLTTANARIAEIDLYLPAARKLVELLTETRAMQVETRERVILSVARSVDARARRAGNEGLLGKYEKTRAYRSEAALKAARTRKKAAA